MKFDADTQTGLAAQQAGIRKLAADLVSAGLLEPADLDMAVRIEIAVRDRRKDRSTPLPEVKVVGFRLR